MWLPQPTGAFVWVQAAAGAALVCRPLEAIAPHFFSTRPWPLGSTSSGGDDRAWEDVARAMGVEPNRLVRLRQGHRAAVGGAPRGQPAGRARPPARTLVSHEPPGARARHSPAPPA